MKTCNVIKLPGAPINFLQDKLDFSFYRQFFGTLVTYYITQTNEIRFYGARREGGIDEILFPDVYGAVSIS